MMPIDRNQFLALWTLDHVPFCNTGLDLASAFMERAFEACELNDEKGMVRTRNAMILARDELVIHCTSRLECRAGDPANVMRLQ
jgi:hypothetical protein